MNPTSNETAEVVADGITEPTPTDAQPNTTETEEVIIDETSSNSDTDSVPEKDGNSNPIEKRYKESSKEALRQKQRADEAEAKARLLEDALSVRQNNSNIFSIAKEDPNRAEQVAQKVFGKSLAEVEDDGLSDDSELSEDQKMQIRIQRGINERFQKEKAQGEIEKIRELESSYFSEQGLIPGSSEHTLAVNQYKDLVRGQSKTSEYVKNAMSVVFKAVTGKPATENALAKKQLEQATISVSNPSQSSKGKTEVQILEEKYAKSVKPNYWNAYGKKK